MTAQTFEAALRGLRIGSYQDHATVRPAAELNFTAGHDSK
jgi:hypothetical protein